MAPGLGANSPVKLQLDRENFNALINRHSQPLRWLVAEKCPCAQDNQKVDANCPICDGKGNSYDVATESDKVETLTAPIDGVIEKENVIWVRDFSGTNYTITSQNCVAYVDGVKKGRQYQVKYTETIILSGTGTAEYISDKLYRIDLPVQVDFGEVQGTLLSVVAITGATTLTVTDLFRNCFEISEDISSSAQVEVSYTYLDPFKFALINNEFTRSETKFLMEIGGDGIMIFPQRWEVGKDDIVVALNSTETQKINKRSSGDIDELPSFYIHELKKAYSIRNNVKYEFTPYVDFVPYKGNKIKWIDNLPTEGEQISFTYTYNTTYKVLKDFPNPRTSEDNRFPRKVALGLYTWNSREEF